MTTIRVLLLTVLLLSSVIWASCHSNTQITDNGEYIKVVESNELCSFSFEYNSEFGLIGPDYVFDFTVPFMYITLMTSAVEAKFGDGSDTDSVEFVPSGIVITVAQPSERNAYDQKKEVLKDWSKHNRYQLITDSSVDITGLEGYFIDYYVNNEHKCAVYFDKNELVWSIELVSRVEDNYSTIKNDFDHIVESFQVLNGDSTLNSNGIK